MTDLLGSPLVVFALALGAGYLLYAWSRTFAPAPPPTGEKTMPYVGGEPYKAQKLQPSYQFFHVALFFTLLHVAALVLETAPRGFLPWTALAYLGIVAAAVLVLRWQ
jgi:NADH:ubiquinone oxidoreductase subunit 3 (subunit A)